MAFGLCGVCVAVFDDGVVLPMFLLIIFANFSNDNFEPFLVYLLVDAAKMKLFCFACVSH